MKNFLHFNFWTLFTTKLRIKALWQYIDVLFPPKEKYLSPQKVMELKIFHVFGDLEVENNIHPNIQN